MLLVPQYGCQGAAISTGLSYIVFFVMRTLFANKYYYVDFKLRKLAILTMITCAFAFQGTFFEFNLYTIVIYLLCMITIFVLYRKTIIEGIALVFKKKKRKR